MTITGVARLLSCLMWILLLCGCSARNMPPEVWQHPQVALGDYQSLHIRPVFNATDRPVDEAVLIKLTDYLEEELTSRGLQVRTTPEEVNGILAVHSDLIVYLPYEQLNVFRPWLRPVAAKARCTVRTRLFDKSTTRSVAEITVTRESLVGSVIGGSKVTSEWLLQDTAAAIAEEISRLMAQ